MPIRRPSPRVKVFREVLLDNSGFSVPGKISNVPGKISDRTGGLQNVLRGGLI